MINKKEITLPKASKLHRYTFKISKIFLGRGSPSPLPKPLPRFHSALRALISRFARTRRFAPRCTLCEFGASRLGGVGARFARTRRSTPLCELCSPVQHLNGSTLINHRLLRKWFLYSTKCFRFCLKYTKIVVGWGSAPDPVGGAYNVPPGPLAVWAWDGDFSNYVPPVTKSWLRACTQE